MEQNQGTVFNKRISLFATKIFLVVGIVVAAALIWFQIKPGVDNNTNVEKMNNNEQRQIKPAELKPEEGMSLLFEKKEYEVKENQNVTVSAVGEPNGKKITAVDLQLVFNPELVRLDKIETTEKYSLVLAEPKIDNEKGTASIAVAIPLESESNANNDAIANLVFTGLKNGTANVSFSDKAVAAAEDESGNVVAVRGSANIVIK